ncbi:MAG: shikimate dehydrogenase [Propionicimonas sp.]
MTTFLSTIAGSFAQPAAENPTVAMVEASFRATGTNARYLNCEVPPERLADAVRGAVAQGWVGFNCSIPHKVAVVPLLDELAPSAQIIGAVNCVVIRDGRLIGENTDGRGFVEALAEFRDPEGERAVVLGAGGAARAIAVELALAGVTDLTIVNRDESRGRALASLVAERTPATARFVPWVGEYVVAREVSIVVNATSIGLYPDVDDRVPIDTVSLLPHMLVADVITNPPRTRLLAEARLAGCQTVDGHGMLANQGAVAIELWTGAPADVTAMREELRRLFP